MLRKPDACVLYWARRIFIFCTWRGGSLLYPTRWILIYSIKRNLASYVQRGGPVHSYAPRDGFPFTSEGRCLFLMFQEANPYVFYAPWDGRLLDIHLSGVLFTLFVSSGVHVIKSANHASETAATSRLVLQVPLGTSSGHHYPPREIFILGHIYFTLRSHFMSRIIYFKEFLREVTFIYVPWGDPNSTTHGEEEPCSPHASRM